MVLKLKNGFNRMGDAVLKIRANQILSTMTDNVYFPNPVPAVVEMDSLLEDFSVSLDECKSHDRYKIAMKNQKRVLLIEALHQWSYYVLQQSRNNEVIAITSGFNIAAARSLRPPLTKPLAPVITFGLNEGELLIRGKRVINAITYLFQYTTAEGLATDKWAAVYGTKAKQVISNLVPGQLYYFRIVAVGARSQLVHSDIVKHIAA